MNGQRTNTIFIVPFTRPLSLENEVGADLRIYASDDLNCFPNQQSTDLVGRADRRALVETLSVKSETERSLHTRAEGLSVTCIVCFTHQLLRSPQLTRIYPPRVRIPALLILALTNAAWSRYLIIATHQSTRLLRVASYDVKDTHALAPTSRLTPPVVDLVS